MKTTGGSTGAGWRRDPSGRFSYRYWDGFAWTDHVATNGRRALDPWTEPPALALTAAASTSSPLRRILWNVYAVPITIQFVYLSVSTLRFDESIILADFLFSLPQMAAMHLHIWDRKTLSPFIWRAYAITFLIWQLVFGFVIQPRLGMGAPLPVALTWLAIQSPMLVAMFRYAFRAWPAAVPAPAPIAPPAPARPRGNALVVWGVSAAVFALCAVIALGVPALSRAYPGGVKAMLYNPTTYEVSAQPLATPPLILWPQLTPAERADLTDLLGKRDFEGLERRIDTLQDAADKDAEQELRVMQALVTLADEDNGAALDEWVVHSPRHYASRAARAQFHFDRAWDARGHGWANEVEEHQWDDMERELEFATEDIDAAIKARPDAAPPHILRIRIANTSGTPAEEEDVVAATTKRFPHSYQAYSAAMNAALPRWGGSYPLMEKLARAAVAANPDDPRFVSLYGTIYSDQADGYEMVQRHRNAVELYDEALSFGVQRECLRDRGWACRALRDTGAAGKDAEKLVKAWPEWADAYVLRAAVANDRGDGAACTRAIEAALKLDPEHAHALEWQQLAAERFGAPAQK